MIHTTDFSLDCRVLDLGVGTGNLSLYFPVPQEQIWGVDFSEKMLEKARVALPGAHLEQVDLLDRDWLPMMNKPFDRILSAYTFHEFADPDKLALISRLARKSLAPGGLIIIGDISFINLVAFRVAHRHYEGLWDEEEYYWFAEIMLTRLEEAGFVVSYQQISTCAGVYCIRCKKG